MQIRRVSEFAGHTAGINSLAAGLGERGTLLISGSEDKTARLWDTRTSKAICGIIGFEEEVDAADFAGDNSIVIASGAYISIYDQRYVSMVHNSKNREAIYVCRGDSGESEIQAISTRGDFVAFVDEDGFPSVLDITDPEPFAGKSARFLGDAHDAMAACICFHPEEPFIATGGFDCQVRVWDVASERVVERSTASLHSNGTHVEANANNSTFNPPFVYAIDFMPWLVHTQDESSGGCEQMMVVSGHADGRIMCTGKNTAVCWTGCHNYSITALQFIRFQPEILATAGLDRTIRLWNSDDIASFDHIDRTEEGTTSSAPRYSFRDSLPQLTRIALDAKPDTLATSEEAPVIFTDENSKIVGFAVE